jgi:hypothetical protein
MDQTSGLSDLVCRLAGAGSRLVIVVVAFHLARSLSWHRRIGCGH